MRETIDTATLGPVRANPRTKGQQFKFMLSELHDFISREMENGRPKSMVLTKLDEARMRANENNQNPLGGN